MEPLAVIQAVQTAGIFCVVVVLVYVIVRLERAVNKGSKRLQTLIRQQQEFEQRLDRLEAKDN